MASEIAKRIILEELEEQMHPEAVEDVIFWSLKEYAERRKGGSMTSGAIIAGAIYLRIEEHEDQFVKSQKYADKMNKGINWE